MDAIDEAVNAAAAEDAEDEAEAAAQDEAMRREAEGAFFSLTGGLAEWVSECPAYRSGRVEPRWNRNAEDPEHDGLFWWCHLTVCGHEGSEMRVSGYGRAVEEAIDRAFEELYTRTGVPLE